MARHGKWGEQQMPAETLPCGSGAYVRVWQGWGVEGWLVEQVLQKGTKEPTSEHHAACTVSPAPTFPDGHLLSGEEGDRQWGPCT